MTSQYFAKVTREKLRGLQTGPSSPFGHLLAGALHIAFLVGCILAWQTGWWLVAVGLWFPIVWMDHAALTRLHEASHRMLFRTAWANELTGILIGSFAFTPLSVYRYVHTQHHAYLGSEKDPEFFPYNQCTASRRRRILFAWMELICGWIFTPAIYSLRTLHAWKSLNRQIRRRLCMEWCLMFVTWTSILFLIPKTSHWACLVVAYLIPTWIAGTLQTVRKFSEHLGRFGDDIYGMTRTVVYQSPWSQPASRSQLHVEHHGTHHRWPKIPFHRLPEATTIVYSSDLQTNIFPNHWTAIRDMLPHLSNPRVGPQWISAAKACPPRTDIT